MGIAAAIVGVLGGLSAVMSILTILELDLGIPSQFTWMFWMVLAGVLLLGAILFSLNKGPAGD